MPLVENPELRLHTLAPVQFAFGNAAGDCVNGFLHRPETGSSGMPSKPVVPGVDELSAGRFNERQTR
jgi:hypothetical protein